MLKWIQSATSGASQKQSPQTTIADIEGGEKYFGLENFGNTWYLIALGYCYNHSFSQLTGHLLTSYCNSVLQALYFCKPFRECVQSYPYLRSLSELAPSSFGLTPAESSDIIQSLLSEQAHRSLSTSTESSQASTPSTSPPATRKRNLSAHRLIRNMSRTSFHRQNTSSTITVTTTEQNDNLLGHLRKLFIKIASQKKRTGVIAPNGFIRKLKNENLMFRSTQQQDAHEFLNYILNVIADILKTTVMTSGEGNSTAPALSLLPLTSVSSSGIVQSDINSITLTSNEETDRLSNPNSTNTATQGRPELSKKTWIHELFEGELANETRCMTCETVTKSSECFLDLSIDIEPNRSISSCLLNFSRSEILCHRNKFYCDSCAGLQEAERMMKIKRLPPVLALHLKRFKQESTETEQRFSKLLHRVVFPMELRLFNTSDDAENPDREYQLFAVVVHIGSNINHGHYITIIKSNEKWIIFDDENVELVSESHVSKYFGDPQESSPSVSASGYILFYQAKDIGISALSKRQLDVYASDNPLPFVNGKNSQTFEHASPNASAIKLNTTFCANGR